MDDTISKVDVPKIARYPQYDGLRAQEDIADNADEPVDDATTESAARTVPPPPIAPSDKNTGQAEFPEETTIIVMKAGIPVHIPVPPDVLLAHKIGNITRAFDANPAKATLSQFEGILDYAVRSNDWANREKAWMELTHMMNTRPDMVNTSLLKAAVENSRSDPDSDVRSTIQDALAAIANKRPDLADASMVDELQRTAAIPFSTREYKVGDGIPYVGDRNADGTLPESGGVGTGRDGCQYDLDDNISRETARKTLATLFKQRPDLDPGHHAEQPAVQRADAKTLPASQASSSPKGRSMASPSAP
jgi:hypothetical protein